MKIRFILIAIMATSLLSACSIYKIDIQQGNVIEQQQLDSVQAGMTQRDVIKILGNPLVKDPFHNNRWDYYYSFKEGQSGKMRQSIATLYFEGEVLKEIKIDKPAAE